MKAALLLGLWVSAGLLVARALPPGERAMAVLFWPFFLGHRAPHADPLTRLCEALGPSDPAQALVAELSAALARLDQRIARVQAAAVGVSPEAPSAALLREAEARLRADHGRLLQAADEAATRLAILVDPSERAEVEALLRDLQRRLSAEEAVG